MKLATWNINSVRLRQDLVLRFLKQHKPDVLCLQETKVMNPLFPGDPFAQAGYIHQAIHGQKGYHGVAILSRLPFAKTNARQFCGKDDTRHISVIPCATFTDPEVARVGLNETEARERNIPFETTVYRIDDLDRAIADGEAHGLVKVLTEPGKDRILGATIAGEHAGELIAEFVAAMRHGIGLNKILGTIHIYPTLAEANKYAAGAWKKAHAPQKVLGYLERFHAWMRG